MIVLDDDDDDAADDDNNDDDDVDAKNSAHLYSAATQHVGGVCALRVYAVCTHPFDTYGYRQPSNDSDSTLECVS